MLFHIQNTRMRAHTHTHTHTYTHTHVTKAPKMLIIILNIFY